VSRRTCIEREPSLQDRSPPKASKGDWPANMILDSFRSYATSNAGKMVAPYAPSGSSGNWAAQNCERAR
jgi:hypothetical protein